MTLVLSTLISQYCQQTLSASHSPPFVRLYLCLYKTTGVPVKIHWWFSFTAWDLVILYLCSFFLSFIQLSSQDFFPCRWQSTSKTIKERICWKLFGRPNILYQTVSLYLHQCWNPTLRILICFQGYASLSNSHTGFF